MSNAGKKFLTWINSADSMEPTGEKEFTAATAVTTTRFPIAEVPPPTEQSQPTPTLPMATEKQTTTNMSLHAKTPASSALRELIPAVKPYSSWNVKQNATFKSGAWIQIRMGDQEGLRRDMVPRVALFKRAPGVHQYLDEDSGNIVLPYSVVDDEALDTVVDAIIACATFEHLEMTLPEDPLKLIYIHCVLVLFGMKKEANIVKERLWSAMGRYELKDTQVRDIWYAFSEENTVEAQYVAPDGAEYVQMMAWQLVNLEIEKKLSDLVLIYINNTPPLKQVLLDRYAKFGTASGYKLLPTGPQVEKKGAITDATAKSSSSSLNATPGPNTSSHWTKFSNEKPQAHTDQSLNKAKQADTSAKDHLAAADTGPVVKTGAKRRRSQAGSDSDNEKEEKKTKTSAAFSASGKRVSVGHSIFGQTPAVKTSSPANNTPDKKFVADKNTDRSQLTNPFGSTLSPAVSKQSVTPDGGSQSSTMLNNLGARPSSAAMSPPPSYPRTGSIGGLPALDASSSLFGRSPTTSHKPGSSIFPSLGSPSARASPLGRTSTKISSVMSIPEKSLLNPAGDGGGIFKFSSNKPTATAGAGKSAASETQAGSGTFGSQPSTGVASSSGNPFQFNASKSKSSGHSFNTTPEVPATPIGGNMFNFQGSSTGSAPSAAFGSQNDTSASANPFQPVTHSIFGQMPIAPPLQPLSHLFGSGKVNTGASSSFMSSFGNPSHPPSGHSTPAQTSLQLATTPTWNFNAMGGGGNAQDTSPLVPGVGADPFVFTGNTTANAPSVGQSGGARRFLAPKGRSGRRR